MLLNDFVDFNDFSEKKCLMGVLVRFRTVFLVVTMSNFGRAGGGLAAGVRCACVTMARDSRKKKVAG